MYVQFSKKTCLILFPLFSILSTYERVFAGVTDSAQVLHKIIAFF
jgi:hypothetical protein